MNVPIPVKLDHEIASVVEVVERRTLEFMRDELGLTPSGIRRRLHRAEQVELRSITAIVGVGSSAGLYVAYSYEDCLIQTMMRRYTAELSVGPDEEDLYIHETASDVVNVIVGNCTADLANRGETISLSPPVLMVGARTIQSRPEATVAVLSLQFSEGMLDLAFVGPKVLFDEQLNFMGGTFQ